MHELRLKRLMIHLKVQCKNASLMPFESNKTFHLQCTRAHKNVMMWISDPSSVNMAVSKLLQNV